jgi:hypothetical protein
MAGDWIKMRGNLWDDPRVASICDITGQKEAAIIGGLYWLWATADQHTEDGLLPGLTGKSIDRKTGIKGFAKALVQIGWLAESDEGVRIVKFEEHNGASAKRRSLDAQRKANVRNPSASQADNPPTNSGQNARSCGAREEKRREDIKPSSSASSQSTPPAPPEPEAPLPVGKTQDPPENPEPIARHVEIAVLLRKEGVLVNSSHPQVVEWAQAGVTDHQLTEATGIAKLRKKDQPFSPGYLAPILDDILKPRKPVDRWWDSDAGIDRKGREVGLTPGSHESYAQFRERIFAHIKSGMVAA